MRVRDASVRANQRCVRSYERTMDGLRLNWAGQLPKRVAWASASPLSEGFAFAPASSQHFNRFTGNSRDPVPRRNALSPADRRSIWSTGSACGTAKSVIPGRQNRLQLAVAAPIIRALRMRCSACCDVLAEGLLEQEQSGPRYQLLVEMKPRHGVFCCPADADSNNIALHTNGLYAHFLFL